MRRLLCRFLDQVVARGTLQVGSPTGPAFTVGDGIQLANAQEAVPLTRDYIAVREAQLKAQDARRSTPTMLAAE